MPFEFDPTLPLRIIFSIPLLGDLWWLWLFLILFFVARSIWLAYCREYYTKQLTFTLLELKIPREVRRSPQAMEQIFAGIHALRNTPSNMKEKWWDGEVTILFSFEMASFGGDLHFYMRVPDKHRNMIETAMYSQYPDVEIAQVEDYVTRLPPTYVEVEKAGYKMFGNELKLEKPDAYPIRTYMDFETSVEEKQLDSISAVLECMAGIKPQEILWLQIIVRPLDDSWKKAGEDLVDKLLKEIREKRGSAPATPEGTTFSYPILTTGDKETVEAIERNVGKPGFETLIRYLYFAPPEIYTTNFGQRALFSAINQYASEWLNRFKHNVFAWTRTSFWYWPHFFPGIRGQARKRRIYRNYRKRYMYEETNAPLAAKLSNMMVFHFGFKAQEFGRMVLNTEELATLFHPPMFVVLTGPLIKRVEARKVGPPAGLPIYGEGEEELPGLKK